MGIEAHERTFEETGSGKPPVFALEDEKRPSLLGEFRGAVLTAEQREEAKTGYYDSKVPFVNIPGVHSSDAEAQRKKEEELKNRVFANAMKTFSIGGIEMTFDEVVTNLEKMGGEYDSQIAQNNQAIVLKESDLAIDPKTGKPFETTEEFNAYQAKAGFCLEGYAIDQTTLNENGQRVSVTGYHYAQQANEVLYGNKEYTTELLTKAASGDLDINALPENVKTDLANMQQKGTTMPEFDLGEILENSTATELNQAGMLPLSVVTPSVRYNTSPTNSPGSP